MFFSKRPSLMAPGALSYSKLSESAKGTFIRALIYESTSMHGVMPEVSSKKVSLKLYEEAAKQGDCLACLRLAYLYAEESNAFGIMADKNKAWAYMILALFHSLYSPFGLDCEIKPFFDRFILWIGDNPMTLKKTYSFIRTYDDPIFHKYKDLINEIFPAFFDQSLSSGARKMKFRSALDNFPGAIDVHLACGFIVNSFTGSYEHDADLLSREKIHIYFNKSVKNLFALYNSNYRFDSPVHAFLLAGFAINVLNYVLWKGKEYSGEVDDCLAEMIRMCKQITENADELGINSEMRGTFNYILSWAYRKGIFVKKNIAKALLCISDCDPEDSLPNVTFDKARIKDKIGMAEEAEMTYKKAYDSYTKLVSNPEETALPADFYNLGFLEVKINGDLERAREYWEKGTSVKMDPIPKPIECLVYQKKCLEKLEKYK